MKNRLIEEEKEYEVTFKGSCTVTARCEDEAREKAWVIGPESYDIEEVTEI